MKQMFICLLILALLAVPSVTLGETALPAKTGQASVPADFANMQWTCGSDGALTAASATEGEVIIARDVIPGSFQRSSSGDIACWQNADGMLMAVTSTMPFAPFEIASVKDFAVGDNEDTNAAVVLYADQKGTLHSYPQDALKKPASIQKKAETIYYNPLSKLFFWIVPGKKEVVSIFGAFANNLNQPFYMGKNVTLVRTPEDKSYGAGLLLSKNVKAQLLFGIVNGLPGILASKPDWVLQQNDNYALFKTEGTVYAALNHFYNEEVLQFVTDQDIPPEGFTLLEDSVLWDGGSWDATHFTPEGVKNMARLLGTFWVEKDSAQTPFVTLPAQQP